MKKEALVTTIWTPSNPQGLPSWSLNLRLLTLALSARTNFSLVKRPLNSKLTIYLILGPEPFWFVMDLQLLWPLVERLFL